TAADQDDALITQARLDGGPVDLAGRDLLLHPDLAHARLRVVGALALRVGGERPLAVAIAARVTLAATDAAGRLRAAHHTTRTVHRRVERLGCVGALGALEDDRVVAHRAADEPLLARTRGRAALAHHPVGAAEVLLTSSVVVVVVHLVHRLG